MLASCRFNALHCVLLFSALGAYLACKEEEQRPPGVADCPDGCLGGPSPIRDANSGSLGMGGSAGAGGSGSGGSAGAAGSAAAGAAGSSTGEGTLSGTIDTVSESLGATTELAGTVQVQAPGADGDQVITTSQPNGGFVLPGIIPVPNLWVGVGPFNADPNSTFVDTLQVVDATRSTPVSLLVMSRSTLQQLVVDSFMVSPVELDPQRGHVVLRFVNDQRQGIPGVTLTMPPPAATSVAYDLGDQIYSDTQTETGARGTLVLVNLAASAYPGVATTITAQVRGASRNVDVHVAAGALTLVTTVIE
jgi:hypothetical protein